MKAGSYVLYSAFRDICAAALTQLQVRVMLRCWLV
jgi:hypothetical protein